jgi:Putative cyclase
MADRRSAASERLTKIKDFLTGQKTAMQIPWDPDSTKFPSRKELPEIPGAPPQAAWVWGPDDFIGRLNLLTPTRVAAAGKEIRDGDIIPLNLPLNVPETPAFDREPFRHEIKVIRENIAYDDIYHLNTQSGTQWDGFRHFAHVPTATFYNGARGTDILGPNANHKCSIHHWAQHGIAGRGILLDFRSYAEAKGIQYDPYDYYPISYEALTQCGQHQGIDIRPAAQGGDIKIGDILFVRSGFVQQYYLKSPEDRRRLALRGHGPREEAGKEENETRYAGVAQEERMLDWLHDCYFAAVAGDAPAFEAWPTHERELPCFPASGRENLERWADDRTEYFLHEHILALWGMPLGEMLDLERLSEKCKEKKRWTFFFTSSPANVPGGVSTHVNGQAIF